MPSLPSPARVEKLARMNATSNLILRRSLKKFKLDKVEILKISVVMIELLSQQDNK